MSRTTPPRPVDVTAIVPEIAAYARTTLRLHPRRGEPTVADSSVGGPLLWPADEPWPTCEREHPEDDEPFQGPTIMVPILQLYLRDACGLVQGPGEADVLQVLWCPFDHEREYMPTTRIVWRRAADVSQAVTEPPAPVRFQTDRYLPEPCVLHPEPVVEYPPQLLLPDEINAELDQWMESKKYRIPTVDEEEREAVYAWAMSVAPGWKMGGWAPVSFRDIKGATCACGAAMNPFLYISSCEWDQGTYHWRPLEEYDRRTNPGGFPPESSNVRVSIGRGYGMQVYTCPVSFDHPHVERMQ